MKSRLFNALLLLSPISSVLVVPGVQGLVPAVLALALLFTLSFVTAVRSNSLPPIAVALAGASCLYLAFLSASQLLLSIFGVPVHDGLILTRESLDLTPFRTTIFSQSLYLSVCVMTFGVVYSMYEERHDKLLVLGVTIFSLYGLLEIAMYVLTGVNSDFLSNRTFGESEERLGSLFQTYTVSGISMQRLKSLSGEPSMYVFSVIPAFIFAVAKRFRLSSIIIGASILLTFSSTAVVAFGTLAISMAIFRRSIVPLLVATMIAALSTAAFYPLIQSLIAETVSKIALESLSGEDRIGSFIRHILFWLDSPPHVFLFGIGFGNARSPDFFSTLLVNTGLLGFITFSVIFFVPVFKLGRTRRNVAMKSSLVTIYVMLMTSVAEYSYLITWIVLGMSYAELRRNRRIKSLVQIPPTKPSASIPC